MTESVIQQVKINERNGRERFVTNRFVSLRNKLRRYRMCMNQAMSLHAALIGSGAIYRAMLTLALKQRLYPSRQL